MGEDINIISLIRIIFICLIVFIIFIATMYSMSLEIDNYRIHEILYFETSILDKFKLSSSYTKYYSYAINQSILGVKSYNGFFEVMLGDCNTNNIMYLVVKDENDVALGNEVIISNEDKVKVFFKVDTPVSNVILYYKTKSVNISQKRLEIFIR